MLRQGGGTTPAKGLSIPKPMNPTKKFTRDGHTSVLSDMDYTESIMEQPDEEVDSETEEFNKMYA